MAKFDACVDLPDPAEQQGVTKSRNRFGCFYSGKPRSPGPKPPWHASWWDTYFNKSIRSERRRLLQQIGLAWTNKLSAAQRTAWETLAGGVTYINYKGQSHNGNGYELFQAVNTLWRYTYGAPWFNFPFPTWPIFLNPPATWNPPAAPALSGIAFSFDAWVQIGVTNAPVDSSWWSAAPYIQKGHVDPSAIRSSYSPARDFLSDFGAATPLLYVPIDFPWSTKDVLRPMTIGYRFLNLNTGVFSNPSWIEW